MKNTPIKSSTNKINVPLPKYLLHSLLCYSCRLRILQYYRVQFIHVLVSPLMHDFSLEKVPKSKRSNSMTRFVLSYYFAFLFK